VEQLVGIKVKLVKLASGLIFATHLKPILRQNGSFLQLLPQFLRGDNSKKKVGGFNPFEKY